MKVSAIKKLAVRNATLGFFAITIATLLFAGCSRGKAQNDLSLSPEYESFEVTTFESIPNSTTRKTVEKSVVPMPGPSSTALEYVEDEVNNTVPITKDSVLMPEIPAEHQTSEAEESGEEVFAYQSFNEPNEGEIDQ